ncbi:MAG: hypothetical protein COX65_08630 [Elusimicrobia bacterium CG_4_10_14_0_2_um_filter_56_8]|nr:MAG: hypothetical protein AUJ51_03315 [Elusimicrobia bacterium CG1_02_56_21]PJA12426.1 MAG: hypothetical protein COX65_08630 [Elusimicrobia bacterium CG_4_10_14_0_2_um_filter_56_8]
MKEKPARKKDLETLALLAAFSLVLYSVFRRPAFALLALALLVLAMFFRGAAARFAAGWLRFSAIAGRINTALILGALYLVLLTPLALLYRLFNSSHANAGPDPAAPTYFKEREHFFVPSDLEKPW